MRLWRDTDPVHDRQLDLIEIVARPGPVDDEEIAFLEHQQEVVPDILAIVDALARFGAEQADRGGVEIARRRDRDEIGSPAERDEAKKNMSPAEKASLGKALNIAADRGWIPEPQ